MYELLALSAFQSSIVHPSKSDIYLGEATTLQAQALSTFSSMTSNTINQDKIIPSFLFSGILGLHFFCDTFSKPSRDINAFLDRLVQSIRLLRGVRATVGDSWDFIRHSDISFLMPQDTSTVDHDDDITHALEDVRAKFSESRTISAYEAKVYCEAISELILVYNAQPLDDVPDGSSGPSMFTAWPVKVSAEYTQLLDERKPGALVVMGYFSILLYTKRAFWAVGEAGRVLLTAIDKYLGEEWADWLVVPKSMLPPL
ncbi:hypothetical protein MMC25_001782 [Agyrium rufum]|nr:hypothetical protein [Agyrium rufum]